MSADQSLGSPQGRWLRDNEKQDNLALAKGMMFGLLFGSVVSIIVIGVAYYLDLDNIRLLIHAIIT
jgi:hypothetical protein